VGASSDFSDMLLVIRHSATGVILAAWQRMSTCVCDIERGIISLGTPNVISCNLISCISLIGVLLFFFQ
jgi:hypothetical protein